jgi:hypothetical protein
LVAALAALAAAPAHAVSIVQFSQIGSADTVVATDNGTTTTITATNAPENVSQDIGGYLGNAFLTLTATSIDAAVQFGAAVAQHFSGSFSLTSQAGGGINILSGTFIDAALGAGPALGITIGAPPDTLSLTSSIIPVNQLQEPVGVGFTLTDVNPVVGIDGATLAGFHSTIAGNVSANEVIDTPEPRSLAILGAGLVAMGLVGKRWNRSGAAA